MDFSVIIVSYNAPNYLRLCLHSVLKAIKDIPAEVIVFDNNSPVRDIENIQVEFPSVRFILSAENLGFGKANNQAVRFAKGKYLLILNPDTFIPEDIFTHLKSCFVNNPNIGAIGPQMIDANGIFHPESKRNIPSIKATFSKMFGSILRTNSLKSSYYIQDVHENENSPVPILTGACLCIEKDVYESIGGFDERYFMYGEDIDLCYSLVLQGYENLYLGEVCIIHYKGESTRKDKQYLKNFYGAMKLFMNKYYAHKKLSKAILSMGIYFKYLLSHSTINNKISHEDNGKPSKILVTSNMTNKQIISKIKNQANQDNLYIQLNGTNILIGKTIKSMA